MQNTTPPTEKKSIVINPTPRARFMAITGAVSAHRELMQSDQLQQGIDFALLEYQRMLADQKADANVAAASHFKMSGALEYIGVLKTLAESAPLFPRIVSPNLDHHA